MLLWQDNLKYSLKWSGDPRVENTHVRNWRRTWTSALWLYLNENLDKKMQACFVVYCHNFFQLIYVPLKSINNCFFQVSFWICSSVYGSNPSWRCCRTTPNSRMTQQLWLDKSPFLVGNWGIGGVFLSYSPIQVDHFVILQDLLIFSPKL